MASKITNAPAPREFDEVMAEIRQGLEASIQANPNDQVHVVTSTDYTALRYGDTLAQVLSISYAAAGTGWSGVRAEIEKIRDKETGRFLGNRVVFQLMRSDVGRY